MQLVLAQHIRPDRLAQFRHDNPRLVDVKPFYSIHHAEPMKSFCLSQYAMLRHFIAYSKDQFLLALEDDAIIKFEEDGFRFPADPDWDLFYLGCNLRGVKPEPAENGFCRITTAYMTHAVAYSRRCVEWILSSYEPTSWQMYDDWLSNQLPNLRAYVMNPMIAYQRPGRSELWQGYTDYTRTIDDGNQLMQAI